MLVLSVYLFFWLVGKDVELYLFMNHDICTFPTVCPFQSCTEMSSHSILTVVQIFVLHGRVL